MYPLQNRKIIFGEEWIEEYEISNETALEWKAGENVNTLILKGVDKPVFLNLSYSGNLSISADEFRIIDVLGYYYIPPCKHIIISMRNCTLSKIFEVVEPPFSEPIETKLEVIDHPGWTLNDYWHSATSGFLEFRTPIMGFMEFIFWGSGELYSATKVGEEWIPTSKRLKPFQEKTVGTVPISVSNRLYNSGSMNMNPNVKFYSFGIVEEYDVSTIAGVLSGLLTGSVAGEVIR